MIELIYEVNIKIKLMDDMIELIYEADKRST